ncbi:MAG: bifunctional glutamine synthetase adenylyltransferase/deadenyltransferase, partial [Pseudomonadota bacterium]
MNHADDESPPNALWTEWVQASRQHAEGDLPESLVEAGPRVFAASEYLATSCLRAPAMLLELWREGDLEHGFGIGEMEERLRQHLADVRGEEDLGVALRGFRRHQMVRIIWRDITRTASLDETLEDLTALADACIRLALERLYASLVES